ncbi:MAG TPA: cation transporter [Planctomycetaceae bacterium]|nr:cation transporter [Planctomycetaceae bacterium]
MQSTNHSAAIYRQVQRANWIGLLFNFGLGLAKLIGGVLASSFALVADSVNSLGDTITSVIVLYSLKVAQFPADDEHPYGHSRAEGIAALTVSLIIIFSALAVAWETLVRLQGQHETPPAWALWIAGINVLIKEGLYRYKITVGRRTGSLATIANAWDHRSDALSALAVLTGLAMVRYGGQNLAWADKVAAMIVALAIVWAGVKLFRQSASELLDVQADEEMVCSIRSTAQRIAGVQAVEKLWVRKSGLEYFIDIHLQVEPTMSVQEGHHIGHLVKQRLIVDYPSIRDVLVHLEPYAGL